MKDEAKDIEPAYTPRAEYECDSSTTHYQGCKCHEARRGADIARLRAQLNEALGSLVAHRDQLAEYQSTPLGAKINELIMERGELREKLAQAERDRESWGNEFSAVCIMKDQLAQSRAEVAQLRAALEIIRIREHMWDIRHDVDEALSSPSPALDAIREAMGALRNGCACPSEMNWTTGKPILCEECEALAKLREVFGEG